MHKRSKKILFAFFKRFIKGD